MQMKKTIQYGVMLLLATGFRPVCEAQSVHSLPDSAASLQETLQWIKLQLSSAKLIHSRFDYYVSYSDVVSTGCVLEFTETKREKDLPGGETYERITVTTLPLGHLESVTYYRRNHEGGLFDEDDAGVDEGDYEWDIQFLAAPHSTIVRRWMYTLRTKQGQDDGSEGSNTHAIVVDDEELAKHLAQAFSQANELCGGGKLFTHDAL